MTLEPEVGQEKKFVRVILPWVIAGGAWVVYLLTLNHFATFSGLFQVSRASGWVWQPEIYSPVSWLVTYPLRWLPAQKIPLGLNLFSAVCAALTLALLARSVCLLPHDRTHDQRQREKGKFALLSISAAWVPPLLAALICGLQLTFWEQATAVSSPAIPWGSGFEMLDLLLFAYVVRCLLEFRIDQRESWLARAALLFGAGMTNNWAMICFFPLFLVALVWIKGLAFFNPRFLIRISLWGLAGLSLYLMLPLVQSFAQIAEVPFWAALRENIRGQTSIVTWLVAFFKQQKQDALILGVTSLLPVFVMSIKWASYFGDTSRLGVALTTLIFRVVHGLFLTVCLWVALDPPFSPRFNPLREELGIPFLTLSYLGALSVGYFAGYFLLLFGRSPSGGMRPSPLMRATSAAITGAIWLLVVVMPAGLVSRNLPQIKLANGPFLKQYADLLLKALPTQGAVVLSDDPSRLMLLQTVSQGVRTNLMFLDTAALKFPDYHRFLKKKYPRRWLADPPKDRDRAVEDMTLLQTVAGLTASNQLFYLHPSFGYYFEVMFPEPHGLVFRLGPCPPNTLITPLLSKTTVQENEAFWERTDDQVLRPLAAAIGPPKPSKDPAGMGPLSKLTYLKTEPNRDATILAGYYSRALDSWGVVMQRQGELEKAAGHFQSAQKLNPDNVVAKVNLECNQNLRAGRKTFVTVSKSIEDEFGKYRSWDQVMGQNGPFDEPRFCYEEGRILVKNSLYRQAAYQFDRTIALAPDNLAARLWLAQLYVTSQMPDQALKIIEQIYARPELLPIPRTNQNELLSVEISAHLARNDVIGAEATVQKTLAKYPGDEGLLATATQVYVNHGRYSNALVFINKELKLSPDNLSALITKGYACLQIGAYEDAIPALSRVLTLETNTSEVHYSALLNRAIAYLRSEKLDQAQHDYEVLQKAFPTAFRVYFGLGDVAYRKKDTNAAIRSYELYLANSPTNTEEFKFVRERLKELKPGAR